MPTPYGDNSYNRYPIPKNKAPKYRGFCLLLPDDPEYLAVMLGHLSKLAQQVYHARDSHYSARDIARVWRRSVDRIVKYGFEPCDGGNPVPTLDAFFQLVEFYEEEEEEEDMRAEIVKLNGTWYLVAPCGDNCEYTYFPLGGGSTIAPDGTLPTQTGKESGDSSIQTVDEIIPNDVDCLAELAAPYTLDRIREFALTVWSAVKLGVENFTGWDDATDVVGIVKDIIAPADGIDNLDSITQAQIIAAFNDSAFRDTAIANWVARVPSSRLQRQALLDWVNTFPFLDGLVPMRSIGRMWVHNSFKFNLQREVTRFAVQCNAGLAPASVVSEIYSQLANIKVWRITVNRDLTSGFVQNLGYFENVCGIAIDDIESYVESDGNNYLSVGMAENGVDYWFQWGVPILANPPAAYSVKHPNQTLNLTNVLPFFNWATNCDVGDSRNGMVQLTYTHANGNISSGRVKIFVVTE